jgi:predicted ATPase/transcriptional regulator with XRE-family HTH domain
MNASDANTPGFSSGEDGFPLHFSEWLKHRRQELDLTQEQLAQRASCSVFAIRKMESGERRPSRQLARTLAQLLKIPAEDQPTFIQVARGERSVECLPLFVPGRDSLPAAAPGPTTGNLPRSLTPFIGREPELAALGQLLQEPQCSLATILGPGGVGKTRLAIEAANQNKDHFPDGVWFVPLAALNSPSLIVPTIADAIDFKFSGPTNHHAQLLRYLHPKKALLVLDNAEHLLDGVGEFTEILVHCPQVKLLVTSRERLNLLSEWVFELQGLPVPANEQLEQMEAYSSVALFLHSARRVRAGFMLHEEERRWVRKICHTLEGMPLGLELSAAWVGTLSCEEIANEIERNLDFLTVSMRDLPQRHRSMRATLDHSWKLLNTEEKIILSRLSVFQGPFKREAAEEICGASFTVLSSLRNKTLLYRTDQDCFSLHELIRQYAVRKLAEDPVELQRVKDRHATYYVNCLAEWEKALKGPQQLETLNEMTQMINNLRQGWRWMVVNGRFDYLKSEQFNSRVFHSSSFSLSLFYEMRLRSWEAVSLFSEVVEFLKSTQTAFERSDHFYRFNAVLGTITAYLGLHQLTVYQHAKARENLEEAILLLENDQSRLERAQARNILGWIYFQQGKMQKSAELMSRSLAECQEERNTWWYLVSSIYLAKVYVFSGRLLECESLCQEGFRSITPGDFRLEIPLRRIHAYLYYFKNEYEKAEQLMQANLQLAHQYESHRVIVANRLTDLCLVALATSRMDVAEKYAQECINLVSEYGESYELAFAMLYLGKCLVARSEAEAGREKFRQVIKLGQTLDAFYLVYWGMVNIAQSYLVEGLTEKTLKIVLYLKDCAVEYKLAQDDGNRLMADLQARLSKEQVEAISMQGNGGISADQAATATLAYALEQVTE